MTGTDPDLERFTRVVRQHELEVLRAVRLWVGRDDAEDVLQGVWLEAWEQRATSRIDLVNLVAAARRRSARRRSARRRRAWVQIDQAEAVAIGADVDEQVETREHAAAIRRTLQTLSRRDQEALHLAVVLGLRHAEIAQVLGLRTTNAASKAVSEARRRFRQAWAVEGR